VADDVELEFSHHSQNRLSLARPWIGKDLDRPLFDQLAESALELLAPPGVRTAQHGKMFGREVGKCLEVNRRPLAEGVPQAEHPGVGKADNVARERLFDRFSLAAKDLLGSLQPDLSARARMDHLHFTSKASCTNS